MNKIALKQFRRQNAGALKLEVQEGPNFDCNYSDSFTVCRNQMTALGKMVSHRNTLSSYNFGKRRVSFYQSKNSEHINTVIVKENLGTVYTGASDKRILKMRIFSEKCSWQYRGNGFDKFYSSASVGNWLYFGGLHNFLFINAFDNSVLIISEPKFSLNMILNCVLIRRDRKSVYMVIGCCFDNRGRVFLVEGLKDKNKNRNVYF